MQSAIDEVAGLSGLPPLKMHAAVFLGQSTEQAEVVG
jgi:hypothetical protein